MVCVLTVSFHVYHCQHCTELRPVIIVRILFSPLITLIVWSCRAARQ